MKRITILLVVLVAALNLIAVPAYRRTFEVKQSNGETITLMLVGDEHMHYYLNTKTGQKMKLTERGEYTQLSETEYTTMKVAAQKRSAEINAKRLERLQNYRANKTLVSQAPSADGPRRVGTFGNMTGNKKGIVILVNFTDKAMNSTHTQSVFNDMFNKQGYNSSGHIGSVSEYFHDQSYGQFNLDFDVVGPVTVSNTMAYYGGNDSYGNDKYAAKMVIEACKLADEQGINFADYDWDGDGYVDQVYVIYAGYGEHAGGGANTIWPHEYSLTYAAYSGDGTGKLRLDNVYIDTYACSCELISGTTLSGIGTACHEFSHCLGYPDLYDTDYSGGLGMDNFDVMCGGSYNGPSGNGEVPCGYTAYERWMAGWLEPEVLSEATTITDMPALNDEPKAYIMYNEKNKNEYFMFENRQSNRWFKYYNNSAAGHGLLITHIDYNATVWQNNAPNDDPSHQRMTWVAADGSYGTPTGSQAQGDFFPGTKKITTFNGTSHTNVGGKLFNKNTDGTYAINHELTEISESSGKISFLVDGGGAKDDGTRYTVTFNAGNGTCPVATLTEQDFRGGVTLPTATGINDDWAIAGWATAPVTKTKESPTLLKVGSLYVPTEDITLYAIYANTFVTPGTNQYELVTEERDNWAGDYLIAYSNTVIANGKTGGTNGIGKQNSAVNPGNNLSGNTISATWGDQYHVTIEAVSGGYLLKTQDGLYNYQSSTTNGIMTGEKTTASNYPLTITFKSDKQIQIVCRTTAFSYNTSGYFRFYKSLGSGQQPVYLYRLMADEKDITYDSNPEDVELTGISIVTLPAKTTYNEGEKLDNTGLTIQADYVDGTSRPIFTGYTTTPEEGSIVTLETKSVTVNYTRGEQTYTTSFDIQVNEMPKYTTTFVIDGIPTSVTQTVASTAINVPEVADITTFVEDEELTYTFAGWSKTKLTTETNTMPEFVSADLTYTPTSDETLYAIFKCQTGTPSFTLSAKVNGTTYYLGSPNTNGFDRVESKDSALPLNYEDGYLWFADQSGTKTYAYSSGSQTNMYFKTEPDVPNHQWTMTTLEDGTVTFQSQSTSRYLAINGTYIRNYKITATSTYTYIWNIEYATSGPGVSYTSRPNSIGRIANYIKHLNTGSGNKENLDKMQQNILHTK